MSRLRRRARPEHARAPASARRGINSVVGVFKAYTTRVGEGPFPTEVQGAEADVLRQIGTPWAEVGTTTGRLTAGRLVRRGAGALRGAASTASTPSAITKLDVLDSLPAIKVCTGYRLHDAELDYPPANIAVLGKVEPIYEELPGWRTPTSSIRRFDQLPSEAQDYIARLCELTGTRLGIVSVGPGREQIIEVNPLF